MECITIEFRLDIYNISMCMILLTLAAPVSYRFTPWSFEYEQETIASKWEYVCGEHLENPRWFIDAVCDRVCVCACVRLRKSDENMKRDGQAFNSLCNWIMEWKKSQPTHRTCIEINNELSIKWFELTLVCMWVCLWMYKWLLTRAGAYSIEHRTLHIMWWDKVVFNANRKN